MNKYLQLAIELAKNSDLRGRTFRLTAVAIRRDGTIVFSHNITVRAPCPPGHAEARVLRKAGYGAKLYVARVTKDGKSTIAKPCVNCERLIKAKRVESVEWTI